MKYARLTVKIIFFAATLFSVIYLGILGFGRAKAKSNGKNIGVAYTVKEHRGRIAVFKAGNEAPELILDGVAVRDLPSYDRELLKNGIPAESEAELRRILEDYDG